MKFHDRHEQEDEKITLSKTVTNIGNLEGVQKKCTNVLLHTIRMIDPRVKSQARGQNNRSRALK